MIPHKEELSLFETLNKTQYQIWPDSADLGQPVSPSMLNRIRVCLGSLKKFYGGRKWVGRNQSAVKAIKIPFEVVDGVARGVELSVLVFTAKGRQYCSVRLTAFSLPQNDVPILKKAVDTLELS
tara:strand:- start:10876 stop:11247 length:372 start_codon:yes stop_codon:yes gene_type:complete